MTTSKDNKKKKFYPVKLDPKIAEYIFKVEPTEFERKIRKNVYLSTLVNRHLMKILPIDDEDDLDYDEWDLEDFMQGQIEKPKEKKNAE